MAKVEFLSTVNSDAVRTKTVTVSKLIVDYLQALQIPLVFGVPGGGIEPFIQALHHSEQAHNTRLLLTRSEAGAVYMADGFYRETGKLGVCCATSGPGATNMMTAVSSAYADGIPLLLITAQTSLVTFGKGAMQEGSCTGVNTLAMFQACTRYNTLVSHPAQLEAKLLTAISHAFCATPGPVHLSIPRDILQTPINSDINPLTLHAFFGQELEPDRHQLNQLKALLDNSLNGAIVIGHGCQEAINEVIQYAESRHWPMVTTPMGRGLVSSHHPLYRGVFGMAGHESARLALNESQAETVLVIGANLDESATCGWDGSTIMSPRMVHIDANPEYLSQSYMAKFNVMGSPRLVFQFLNNQISHSYLKNCHVIPPKIAKLPNRISLLHKKDCLKDSYPVNPRRLFWHLSQQAPEQTRLFADAGNSFFWALHYWHQHYPQQIEHNQFRISIGFAAMGWACAAVIGSALAAPEYPHICFVGDGSLLMNGLELSVAKEHHLNILYVVLNDSSLGTVKHGQRLQGLEPASFKLPEVNFAMLAQALGIEAYRIEDMDQLIALGIDAFFKRPGPKLLDFKVDGDIAPPIGERLRSLNMQPG